MRTHHILTATAICGLCGFLGCGPDTSPTFDVTIDASFTPEERGAILGDLDAWRRETFGRFAFRLIDSTANVDTITIINSDDDPNLPGEFAHTLYETAHNTAKIYVAPGLSLDVFRWTLLHEIGHAVGLPHYFGPECAVMRPHINTAACMTLQPVDLAAFEEKWQ